ncbi:MAG: D-alanyl-D-alanine carboxypeptidase [Candidatus Yonathbacteria bacterium]|nr:D-alanyl-D-alanine carboxypeptidase [Candidatus Yonathbacteria bacterium]
MNTKKNREQLVTKRAHALIVVLGGGAGLAITLQGLLSFAIPTEAQTNANVSAQEEIRSMKSVNPFENVSLEARAVYVFNLKTNAVLYAKNENEKLPLASITKLMTALVAREYMPLGAVITLTKDDLASEGDSGFRPGERWRLGDILNAMLLVSSNDAAHAVSEFVGGSGRIEIDPATAHNNFVKMMNEKANALKLDQMEFFNESGLDINETQNGGYGSARNVATLFSELWKRYPENVEITARKYVHILSQDEIDHFLANTNEIIGRIPGLIASKTGFTNISGGNLAVIFDKGLGEPVVAVVLGSSYKERFDDMQKLVEASLKEQ